MGSNPTKVFGDARRSIQS